MSKTLPNVGLTGAYATGVDGWGGSMDANLVRLSVLVQGGAINFLSALPGSPADGDVYVLKGDATANANSIAYYDGAAWEYIVPLEGWRIYDRTANVLMLFSGTAWAEFSSGGATTLAALTDVDETTAPTDGQALVYSATEHKWVPATVSSSSAMGPLIVAVSDESTAITTSSKVTFRAPKAATITKIKASLNVASTSGLVTVDVKVNGTSMFSTLLTIDATEKTSATAATPAVIASGTWADDDEIAVTVTGAGTGAAGLKLTFIG